MNIRNFAICTALGATLVLFTGCSTSESPKPESANIPPPVAGLSTERVQAELDGLRCIDTRDILDTPDMTADLYFGTMADYVSGTLGGSASEWRSAIDWWWQNACSG
jgi:hypothetical protein